MNQVISDETLNAYVDGEFDVDESEALIARMRDDPELALRVGNLRSLQSMVRLAYVEPPVKANWMSRTVPGRHIMQRCAFGCLVLLAGLSGGWMLHAMESRSGARAPAGQEFMPGAYQPVSLARKPDPNRVMLHIDSASPEKMKVVLDQAEWYLDKAERQGRSIELEVIANSHGLDLLRTRVSPYSERIARMKQRHANLQFVACSQSIARFRNEGQNVVLLPAAEAAPTAISEIITRLQQGWTYVRV